MNKGWLTLIPGSKQSVYVVPYSIELSQSSYVGHSIFDSLNTSTHRQLSICYSVGNSQSMKELVKTSPASCGPNGHYPPPRCKDLCSYQQPFMR